MRIVLDTNVIISALLNSTGTPAKVLNAVVADELTLLWDDRILYEYRDVLNRPRFNFKEEDVDDLLAYLDHVAEFVTAAPLPYEIPDPDDVPFLEVALSGEADYLITGNRQDFGRAPKGLKILSPAEFIKVITRL